ncbi:MAG TPA: cupin domain-containing protein [Candidatus Acidoferrales bacterium]|nr:cupin domain-containing protein [Candidatus Acidoferrales bacterium]
MDDATKMIAHLGLIPHPEGGWYAETYRSALTVHANGAPRSALTNVYFLLDGTTFSAYHRLDADETWHFYLGNELTISVIGVDGVLEERRLGPDGPWQTTIVAGSFFAASLTNQTGYALVGCSVAPGFEFAGFDLAKRDALVARFPEYSDSIRRLTRA